MTEVCSPVNTVVAGTDVRNVCWNPQHKQAEVMDNLASLHLNYTAAFPKGCYEDMQRHFAPAVAGECGEMHPQRPLQQENVVWAGGELEWTGAGVKKELTA